MYPVIICVISYLQFATKVLAQLYLLTFSTSVREIYHFVPFHLIQCCLSWWSRYCSFTERCRGKGVSYSSDVPKISCQRIFELSDSAVLRIFVVDWRPFRAFENIFWYSCNINKGGISLPKQFEHNLKIRSNFWVQFRILISGNTKPRQNEVDGFFYNLAEFFVKYFHDSRRQRYAILSFYSFIYSHSAKRDCVLPVI